MPIPAYVAAKEQMIVLAVARKIRLLRWASRSDTVVVARAATVAVALDVAVAVAVAVACAVAVVFDLVPVDGDTSLVPNLEK